MTTPFIWCDPCFGHEVDPWEPHLVFEVDTFLVARERQVMQDYAEWQWTQVHPSLRLSGYVLHLGVPYDLGRRRRILMTPRQAETSPVRAFAWPVAA